MFVNLLDTSQHKTRCLVLIVEICWFVFCIRIGGTPGTQRDLESPSAWKLLHSFLHGPGVDTDIPLQVVLNGKLK